MRLRTVVLSAMCALLLALPAFSQGLPTGTLAGNVKASDGTALPGVLVTVTSPALQGARTATTNESGDYNIPLLPPGEYQVSFELEGFIAPQRDLKISAAQNIRLDAEMGQSTVSEEIVVTGTYETISTTPQAATTYEKEFVEQLPVERNLRETVLLTPGVSATGPGGAQTRGITIAGSQSYENLFLVNGVVVNENLRGQANVLFIEDAIEETTTTVSGISAEYGRFAGGVVNMITKSGGNELHGTFRTNFTNDSWESETPLTTGQIDEVNKRYEATLGGWLWKDKLWYFLAGRDFESITTGQTFTTNLSYPKGTDQQRYEGKVTLSPFQGHRLVGSYIQVEEEDLGNSFGNILDLASLNDRSLPQELMALNYTGVLTENVFVEAQYSERQYTFENSGSKFTDRIFGTLLVDGGSGERWWSPTFCGVCSPEQRDNENLLVKGSWFLSTESLGSHDLALGYDTFNDIRIANNFQSGSNFRLFITDTIIKNGQLYMQMLPNNNSTIIQWNPILQASLGTEFITNSFFINDRWRLNDNLSFNLGVRYDENEGTDASGQTVASDSKISPRLSMAWDPKGDGNVVINASYGEYVAAIASTQANATAQGGNSAEYRWHYRGPAINADPNGALIGTEDALNIFWNWFDSQGGVNNTSNIRSINIPGGTTIIRESLASPSTTEYALGISLRLGGKGLLRTDYVHRDAEDFYIDQLNLSTGRTTTPNGTAADLANIENDNSLLERVYDGLHTQFQYRLDRLSLGGNWTWSHARGNFDGETTANGPVRFSNNYPEYFDMDWYSPRGDLSIDQRHRIRLFAVYDIINNSRNTLNVGLLQNYYSGLPYGAVGRVATQPFVTNPGYVLPPTTVTYYYTSRDAFHTDDITSTDLTLNYSFHWQLFGKDMEVFLQPEMLNVFDEHGVVNVNTTVNDRTRTTALQPFNPFTDSPVEGVHWAKGTSFGKPTNEDDFQQPRTFRFSVGFRF